MNDGEATSSEKASTVLCSDAELPRRVQCSFRWWPDPVPRAPKPEVALR
jgi:hypothetical protein